MRAFSVASDGLGRIRPAAEQYAIKSGSIRRHTRETCQIQRHNADRFFLIGSGDQHHRPAITSGAVDFSTDYIPG